jgi:hypothetical protein
LLLRLKGSLNEYELDLVENGWRVLFTRTTDLVQRLQSSPSKPPLPSSTNTTC